MQILWNDADNLSGFKTYKTYANAVKAAEKEVGDARVKVIIAATQNGRFFPVAIGQAALDAGLHFRMCVTN